MCICVEVWKSVFTQVCLFFTPVNELVYKPAEVMMAFVSQSFALYSPSYVKLQCLKTTDLSPTLTCQ